MNVRGTFALSILLIVSFAASPATHPASAPTTRATKPAFNIGQHVQVKWGLTWRNASINNKRGEWFLITYEPGRSQEWVEIWRVRNTGSKEDPIGYAQPNGVYRKGANPPSEKPGDAPEPTGSRAQSDTPANSQKDEPEVAVDMAKANVSLCREVKLAVEPSNAALAADPEPASSKPLIKTPARLSPTVTGRDVDAILFSDPFHAIAVVVYGEGTAFTTHKSSLDRIDLVTGKLVSMKLPLGGKADDLSPDGKFLLMHATGRTTGQNDRVDLWQIDGDAPQHVVSFKPYESGSWAERNVVNARFLDNDHFFTAGGRGDLFLWEVKTAKAIWSAHIYTDEPIVLSGSHRLLAINDEAFVKIVDPMTGKLIRRCQYPPNAFPRGVLAFSPDGKQIAALDNTSLTIFNIDQAQVATDFGIENVPALKLAWAQDGDLLLDNNLLASPTAGMIVWRYEHVKGALYRQVFRYAGRFWYLGGAERQAPSLVSVSLPTLDAKTAAANPKTDAFLVVPGTKVSLEIDVPGELHDQTVNGLTKILNANGVTIADGQAIKVKANISSGDAVEVNYQRAGQFGATEKMSVPTWVSKLQVLDADGKVALERQSRTSPPMMSMVNKDQSIQDAVNQQNKPTASLFTNSAIPKYILKPGEKPGFGESTLPAEGGP